MIMNNIKTFEDLKLLLRRDTPANINVDTGRSREVTLFINDGHELKKHLEKLKRFFE